MTVKLNLEAGTQEELEKMLLMLGSALSPKTAQPPARAPAPVVPKPKRKPATFPVPKAKSPEADGVWDPRNKLSEDEGAAMVDEYRQGDISHRELAEKYDLGVSTVARILKAAGCEAPEPAYALTAEQREDARVSYAAGELNQKELAAKYDVTMGTIGRTLAGVPRPGRDDSAQGKAKRSRVPFATRQALAAEYAEGGTTMQELSDKFGLNRTTVSAIITQAGLNRGRDRKLTAEQRAEIVERYEQGNENQSELARAFGVSPPTIHHLIHRDAPEPEPDTEYNEDGNEVGPMERRPGRKRRADYSERLAQLKRRRKPEG